MNREIFHCFHKVFTLDKLIFNCFFFAILNFWLEMHCNLKQTSHITLFQNIPQILYLTHHWRFFFCSSFYLMTLKWNAFAIQKYTSILFQEYTSLHIAYVFFLLKIQTIQNKFSICEFGFIVFFFLMDYFYCWFAIL